MLSEFFLSVLGNGLIIEEFFSRTLFTDMSLLITLIALSDANFGRRRKFFNLGNGGACT